MKRSGSGARVKVSADGKGVVSHAGAAVLRELATEDAITQLSLRRGGSNHDPRCSATSQDRRAR